MKRILVCFLLAILATTYSFAGYLENTVIVNTEDAKANGYDDSRKMVRDSQGTLFYATRIKYENFYQIYVFKSLDEGMTWNTTNNGLPIANVSGYHARVPSIAIDSQDRIHVIWYQGDSLNSGTNQRVIKYSQGYEQGNSWSTWINIAEPAGYSEINEYWQEHPVLCIGALDQLYVAWEGRDINSPQDSDEQYMSQIFFSKSLDNGASWSSYQLIHAGLDSTQSRPAITVDHNGRLYVLMYSKQALAYPAIWLSQSTDDGASWSSWGNVSNNDAFDNRHVSVTVNSKNHLHFVWRAIDKYHPNYTQIQYRRYVGGRLSPRRILNTNKMIYNFNPSIGIDSHNQVHVVWCQTPEASGYPNEEPETGNIIYRRQQGKKWIVPVEVSTEENNTWPSLRWSPNFMNGGYLDITWEKSAESPYQIMHYSENLF